MVKSGEFGENLMLREERGLDHEGRERIRRARKGEEERDERGERKETKRGRIS